MRCLVLAFATLACSSPALAQFSDSPSCTADGKRTITVSGTSTIKVKPDTAAFEIAVQTDGQRVQDVWNQNAEKTRTVLAALIGAGVKNDQVQTSLRVQPMREDIRDREGFRVVNGLTVSGVSPDALPAVLQAALTAGANSLGYVNFLVSDPKSLRDSGMDLAFGDARSKAERMAALAGGTLGLALCLSDGAGSGGAFVARETFALAAAPPIESGLSTVSFSVRVVFELR